MWKSFIQYITSLGYWGLLVLGGIVFSTSGYLKAFQIPSMEPEHYLYILLGVLIIAPFLVFHKLRLKQDEMPLVSVSRFFQSPLYRTYYKDDRPTHTEEIYNVIQVWFKNDPVLPTDKSVAKQVTA